MPRTLPVMHHVVFAVAPERRDAAVQFLESLGFRFHRHELTDVGLQVMLDWDGGVEIVTPTAPDDRNPGSVAEFLAREGDGVYSVVMRVDDADEAVDHHLRHAVDAALYESALVVGPTRLLSDFDSTLRAGGGCGRCARRAATIRGHIGSAHKLSPGGGQSEHTRRAGPGFAVLQQN